MTAWLTKSGNNPMRFRVCPIETVMPITGGMGTLFGPFLGAVGIILLRDIISNYTESWGFIMGILFMAAVLGFRNGLMGILRTKLKLNI